MFTIYHIIIYLQGLYSIIISLSSGHIRIFNGINFIFSLLTITMTAQQVYTRSDEGDGNLFM